MWVLQYIIPVATIALSYTLGRLEHRHEYKRNIIKERYEEFYVPFVIMIYVYQPWNFKFSKFPSEHRASLIDLIRRNLHHIDEESLVFVRKLSELDIWVNAYDKHPEENFFDSLTDKARDEMDCVFTDMTIAILEQSIILSTKLKRPKLAQDALSMMRAKSGQKFL